MNALYNVPVQELQASAVVLELENKIRAAGLVNTARWFPCLNMPCTNTVAALQTLSLTGRFAPGGGVLT